MLFSPILLRFLTRILDSVQWLTLEGLVFFGDNIDGCIQFLHSIEAPQLSRLYIHGTGTKQQTFSNRTVRFLESITSTSPHVRFHFKNVILQNSREWHFIIERMDLSSLELFVWSISSFRSIFQIDTRWFLRLRMINLKERVLCQKSIPSTQAIGTKEQALCRAISIPKSKAAITKKCA